MSESSRPGDGSDEPAPDAAHPAAYPPEPADRAPVVPASADAGTTRALAALLKLSPFLDLHSHAGNVEKHRLRGQVCFVLDLLVRLVVVALLLGVITAVAWKTLAPLPEINP